MGGDVDGAVDGHRLRQRLPQAPHSTLWFTTQMRHQYSAVFQGSRNLSRARDRIDRAADICWGDIEKRGSDVPEGGRRILQRLASQKASLTSACRTELARLPSLN